jgi:hypothetical protein
VTSLRRYLCAERTGVAATDPEGTRRLRSRVHQGRAEALFQEAIGIYEREMDTEHFVYLSTLNNLAAVAMATKRFKEAERCLGDVRESARSTQARAA